MIYQNKTKIPEKNLMSLVNYKKQQVTLTIHELFECNVLWNCLKFCDKMYLSNRMRTFETQNIVKQFLEIWRLMFHFFSQVNAWSKSQYLFYNLKKSDFYIVVNFRYLLLLSQFTHPQERMSLIIEIINLIVPK